MKTKMELPHLADERLVSNAQEYFLRLFSEMDF